MHVHVRRKVNIVVFAADDKSCKYCMGAEIYFGDLIRKVGESFGSSVEESAWMTIVSSSAKLRA